jgi:predicted PurR-regulated permease PerM
MVATAKPRWAKMATKTNNESGSPIPLVHSWPNKAAKVFVATTLGVLLYVAHAALIPVALALLLALILSGPVETLHKKHFPRAASAALILLIALGLMGGTVALLWTPVQGWYAAAPQTVATIKRKVRPVARFIDQLEKFRKDAAIMNASGHGANTFAPPVATPPTESAPALIIDASGPVLAGVLTFVIITLSLLTGGPPMLARMTAAFVDNLKASNVLNIIEKVRAEVGHFYLTTTLMNVGLGTATGLAMWAWGMPTPYLWGAMAAVLNYIPYAGSATTMLIITVAAVVSFDTLGHVVGVAGSYLGLATIEGQLVHPLLVGRRFEVNPLLIFLGLWFGWLFWGTAGILLATPTLVALKVIAENSKNGGPMMKFLGPNDQTPARDDRLRELSRRLRV